MPATSTAAIPTISEAKYYLVDILGPEAISAPSKSNKSSGKSDVWATPWPSADHLPFFLQNAYRFYQAKLFDRPCLLMLAMTPKGETPAVVRKHWQAVSKHFHGDVIYLIETVSSYNRKRLIDQRVPFLVPGNQLYLPGLGIDLREYFKPGRQAEITHLSAPAQVLVLREILQHDCAGLPAKDLAQRLNYSPMTITRAIKELTDQHLATAEKVGRAKYLSFSAAGRALWEVAQPMLQSPVAKRIWMSWSDEETWKGKFKGRIAGESALAHYTELANTGVIQWALTSVDWSELSKKKSVRLLETRPTKVERPFSNGREEVELEIWTYRPDAITPDKPCVDPLSLWLSLASNTDERVEMARESLLEQVWSVLPW